MLAAVIINTCRNNHLILGYILASQSHKITECSRLEEISGGHLAQPLSPDDKWLLSISRDEDSTPPGGNLCQCSVNHIVKKWFLMFRGTLLCFSVCPFPAGTSGKSLSLLSLLSPFRYFYTLSRTP